MKTQELFNLLESNPEKSLLFQYQPNQFVRANYHITEVKHININSVDCGANTDTWKETVIQLWESPSEKNKRDFMSVSKALSILNKVGIIKAYDLESEVKIEYSNENFNTAQLFINGYDVTKNNLTLNLSIEKTKCKSPSTCIIVPEENMLVEQTNNGCTPGSNCC